MSGGLFALIRYGASFVNWEFVENENKIENKKNRENKKNIGNIKHNQYNNPNTQFSVMNQKTQLMSKL